MEVIGPWTGWLVVDVDIIILVSAIMLCIFTQNQDPALHNAHDR